MKKSIFIRFMFITAVLLTVNCSIQTTECLGTETGNPVIIGCALSAKELFESMDSWLPSTYLVNGDAQLSASFSQTNAPVASLKKQSVLLQSDTFSAMDTVYQIDTVYDTILRPKYVYIEDTVVNNYSKTDTVLDPVYNGTLISTYLHKDTTFVIDTVFLTDTSLVPRYDTLGISEVAPVRIVMAADTVQGKFVNKAGSVLTDSIQSFTLKDNSNPVSFTSSNELKPFINQYDSSLFSIKRTATINGQICSELYTSSDGDSGLYSASGLSVPAAKLVAVYENKSRSTKTEIDVSFDAGSDRSIATVFNNRISLLHRTKMQNGKELENVFYSGNGMANNQDTAYLIVSRNMTDTAVSIQYRSIKGDDLLDHNQNKLVSIVKQEQFQNNDVKSIIIVSLLDKPLSKRESPESFQFKANIDYGKGRIGEFNARIDLTKNILTGIYAWNGVEYQIYYNFTTDELTKERVK